MQAYPPAQRSLVEFKTNMLMGVYNADLRKTCLIFMPKEIKHEREIKAVLDHQLVNLRTYNMDPRALPKICQGYIVLMGMIGAR